MTKQAEVLWWYAAHEDDEHVNGPFPTAEAAIAEGRNDIGHDEVIWIFAGNRMKVRFDRLFDSQDDEDMAYGVMNVDINMVADLVDGANDNCWGDDGMHFGLSEALQDDLMAVVKAAQLTEPTPGRADRVSKAVQDWFEADVSRQPKAYMLDLHAWQRIPPEPENEAGAENSAVNPEP